MYVRNSYTIVYGHRSAVKQRTRINYTVEFVTVFIPFKFLKFNTFSLLSFFIHLPSFLLLKTAKNNTYSIRKQKYYSNEWSDRILKILLFLSCHVRSLFSLGFMFDILVIYLENVFACIVNYIVATPLILAYLVDQLWSLVFIPSFMVTNSILHLPNWKEYIKWLI